MSNDDNNSNSNSNSRGDEDDAEDYTFDCTTAPYGRTCVSADRQEKREIDPLKRACEEHQAKRRRMEIYYNVPQGGKVTDEQRQKYRDDDERREIAEMDTELLRRCIHSNDKEDIGKRNALQLFDSLTAPHGIIYVPTDANNGIRINKLNEIVTTQHAMIQDLRKAIDYYQHVVWRNNYRADDDDDDDDDASLDSPPSTSGLSTSTDGLSSDDDNEDDNSSCSRGIRSTLDSDGDSDGDSDSRCMPRKPLPLGIEYKVILFKHRSNHISRIATMPAGQPVIDLCDSD